MTTFGTDSHTGGSIEPSLQISTRNNQRYPNQFFDLAQQYMPVTIKELFRWCTFYFYNSPLINAAMKKVSRYPITDLIFEDESESVRNVWETVFSKNLRIKDRLMEVNLDYHVYGNAFVSLHLPFTRFLICTRCKNRQPIAQWQWRFLGIDLKFAGVCRACGHNGAVDVKDVPYKDAKGVRIIRWNPENIQIKFNEYTGRYTYMYSVPSRLRTMIMRGDRDIVEEIPLIVLDALRERRMIRFNSDSIKHLKCPSLAEQDQGWGKPAILHVLKDLYYLYTLRRAQEAIALEHIVPFDLIYPMPNAQQDPYAHTDLANWRHKIEDVIQKHRRDPNFKAVIPIPVGFGRLGGDGKALLLSPEMNYLTQTIVGGMGFPSEFLFGGMNFTGSSISLRMLENDFVQNRSQLLELTCWIKDKLRLWLSLPDAKDMRMADFRMADDVQRNQQFIGLNAQGKLSDQTLFAELGIDWEQEQKKLMQEAYVKNILADIQTKSSARSQGEAQIIQQNYQQKIQEMLQKAQEEAQKKLHEQGMQPGGENLHPSGGLTGDIGGGAPNETAEGDISTKIKGWAEHLSKGDPNEAQSTLADLKAKMPDVGFAVEQAYNQLKAAPGSAGGQGTKAMKTEVNMDPMPEQRAPRRSGVY